MKIKDIYESTTAGSIATVATPMSTQKRNGVGKGIYGNEPKDSMFKGAKTKKPYANSKVNESKMKELAMDMRNMDNGNFQKKYKKSKEQLKFVLGDPDAKKTVQEADLQEDDLIIVPGQGRSRKTGLIKHGESRLDHEVEMARSDLFSAAKNAKQVYELIADVSEEEGLEGWVQEKIIKANDYLNTVREYLEGKQIQQESVVEGARVDSLVTDALKIMRGSELSDAVRALKTVLGDRAYNERRGFYNFYIKQMLDMYGQQGLAEKIDSRFRKTEWIPIADALKILKHYGATIEEWGGHFHFAYYDREGVRKRIEDLTWNADNTRNVRLSILNQAVRELKAQQQGISEGAKVDRMVKHIAKSEKKLGKSKDEAENIAWATANKRGMLLNKYRLIKQ